MYIIYVHCLPSLILYLPISALFSPTGELVTVKGHPPIPSKNAQAVSMIWEKVLNEELFQVGDDEVRLENRVCVFTFVGACNECIVVYLGTLKCVCARMMGVFASQITQEEVETI